MGCFLRDDTSKADINKRLINYFMYVKSWVERYFSSKYKVCSANVGYLFVYVGIPVSTCIITKK